MARTTITPQRVTSSGLTATFEPANVDGNMLRLAPGRVLEVKNASGAPITVTIPTPGTVDGLAIADRTITVAATSGHQRIALGTVAAYKQTGGVAHVDYSAVTSVTVAVLDNP